MIRISFLNALIKVNFVFSRYIVIHPLFPNI